MRTVNKANGIAVGEKVKNFLGVDQNGNTIELYELLKNGKVVIVFYRGQWCPICMPHIKKIQNDLDTIKEKGASVVLISPEKQENIQKTILKTNVTIPILYDKDYKIMKDFDLHFIPSKGLRILYNIFLRADLKNVQSDDSQTLPVPATFVIDKDSTIIWRHFNRDYKKRSKVKDILDHL
jgi:peroxiredoxin